MKTEPNQVKGKSSDGTNFTQLEVNLSDGSTLTAEGAMTVKFTKPTKTFV